MTLLAEHLTERVNLDCEPWPQQVNLDDDPDPNTWHQHVVQNYGHILNS